MLFLKWGLMLAVCPVVITIAAASSGAAGSSSRIDGLEGARHTTTTTTTPPTVAASLAPTPNGGRQSGDASNHRYTTDTVSHRLSRRGEFISVADSISNSRTNTTTNSSSEQPNLRGIMENFADDFVSPPDSHLSDDIFNREPYYYDAYYDDSFTTEGELIPKQQQIPTEVDTNTLLANQAVDITQPLPVDDTISGDLELRLLGADLQEQLGYVLGHLTNGTLRSRRHQAPVRHHDPRQSQGISVGIQEGSCPPPVHSLPPGLCSVPPCTSHMMCYTQKMCCFNGCTYTCTEPVRPPPVIDWLEDRGNRAPLLDPLNPALPLRFESSPLSYGTGGGETVRLPGGCTLTAAKYQELKHFMEADSIKDCLCSGGEVVCVVKSSPDQ